MIKPGGSYSRNLKIINTHVSIHSYRLATKTSSVPISRVLFLESKYITMRRLSFIYPKSHPLDEAFYPPSSLMSGGQPSTDGIRELAAFSWHSPVITHRLVVSYTTFSPLPHMLAVVFFYQDLLSPIASIFRSEAPCAARTFLSHYPCQRQTGTLLALAKLLNYPVTPTEIIEIIMKNRL